MSWEEAPWWLPTVWVLAMTMLGLLAAAARPPRAARRVWLVAVLVCGALAVALSASQQATNRAALINETERLAELGSRLDDLARLLPEGPGSTPGQTFDTVAAAIRALNDRIADLEGRTLALQEKTRGRTIDRQIAAEMAAFLRRSGPHRVIVSSVPDDVEAHNYANQIVNILRDAGWEALGPQRTTIFGEAPTMAVTLFVRDAVAPPEAVRILIDAFARFNIPYQSGIMPSAAIPDPATIELFVSHKS